MNRPHRRAAVLAGLMLDVLSLLALIGAVLAGAVPAPQAAVPALVLGAFITFGVTYLYLTRPQATRGDMS